MDEQIKKKALWMLTYGVYVIGTKDGASVHAFTATWLSQASFKPPLVMLGVLADGRSAHAIRQTKLFSVSILGEGQKETAQNFFKCPDPKDGKFGTVAYEIGTNGCPIIKDAPAFLECRVVEVLAKGDHLVVVGEVTESGFKGEKAPLLLSSTPWKYGG